MSFDREESQSEIPHASELFLGDRGALPLETRRAIVQLLAGPALEEGRHSKLWPILVRDENLIRSRLGDLFLDLVIDTDAQVAFVRQADCGDLETPKLLRRAPLTFIDSVLLVFLRQQLTRSQNQGERAAVSIREIHEHLAVYETAANTDRSGFTKRCQAALKKMKKYSILRKMRGAEDRYEISPTLKLLLTAEELQALIDAYRGILEGRFAVSTDPDVEDDSQELNDELEDA